MEGNFSVLSFGYYTAGSLRFDDVPFRRGTVVYLVGHDVIFHRSSNESSKFVNRFKLFRDGLEFYLAKKIHEISLSNDPNKLLPFQIDERHVVPRYSKREYNGVDGDKLIADYLNLIRLDQSVIRSVKNLGKLMV
jgi:hypothetical protein